MPTNFHLALPFGKKPMFSTTYLVGRDFFIYVKLLIQYLKTSKSTTKIIVNEKKKSLNPTIDYRNIVQNCLNSGQTKESMNNF